MIRCEEAGVGPYGQRDLQTVLHLIDTADRLAGDAPSFWKADLADTRAKALSLLGRHDDARRSRTISPGTADPTDARPSSDPLVLRPGALRRELGARRSRERGRGGHRT